MAAASFSVSCSSSNGFLPLQMGYEFGSEPGWVLARMRGMAGEASNYGREGGGMKDLAGGTWVEESGWKTLSLFTLLSYPSHQTFGLIRMRNGPV